MPRAPGAREIPTNKKKPIPRARRAYRPIARAPLTPRARSRARRRLSARAPQSTSADLTLARAFDAPLSHGTDADNIPRRGFTVKRARDASAGECGTRARRRDLDGGEYAVARAMDP